MFRNGRGKCLSLTGEKQDAKIDLSMALVVLIGGPAAMAQSGSSDRVVKHCRPGPCRAKPRSAIASRARATCPTEKNLSDPNDPLSKENAALDKKIKSICRGC